MHRITRAPVLFLLAIALIVPVAPCARGPDGSVAPVSRDTIVVGSKGFTEQEVVAEIVAQAIERRTDARVERRLRLGDANICHAALLAGDIDVYVEYTGVGLAMLGAGRTPDVSGDFAALLRGYEERFGLEWAPLLGFDTRDVVAVPGAAASEHGWARISDLGSAADGIILVCTPEFFLRDEGYKALSEAYGFRFAKVVSIAPEHRKIALGTGQLYAFVTHATDPGIASLGLRVLGDDRGHFMPYAAAPVVRGAVLGAHPGLHDVFDLLAGRVGDAAMAEMVGRVEGEGRSAAGEAALFLDRIGLVERPAPPDTTSRSPGPIPAILSTDPEGPSMPIDLMLREFSLSSIPEFAALIAALVFVIVGRHRRPAAFFMIAVGLLVFMHLLWPFYREWVFRRSAMEGWYFGQERPWFVGWSVAMNLSRAGMLALMLIAALGWRGSGREPLAAVPVGPGSGPPAPAWAPTGSARGGGLPAISKGLYLGLIVGAFGAGLVLMLPAQAFIYMDRGRNAPIGLGFACGAELFIILGAVMLAILVYKLWARIQGEPTTSTTPGKAVGFLFIPFFNFYWVFRAYWGWTKDYNALVARRGIAAARAPEGLALTFCILTLVAVPTGLVPGLGLLVGAINIVLLGVLLNTAISGVNAIVAAGPAVRAIEDEAGGL